MVHSFECMIILTHANYKQCSTVLLQLLIGQRAVHLVAVTVTLATLVYCVRMMMMSVGTRHRVLMVLLVTIKDLMTTRVLAPLDILGSTALKILMLVLMKLLVKMELLAT